MTAAPKPCPFCGEQECEYANIEVGEYRWILITLDPEVEYECENEPMPARYAGEHKWFELNFDGVSGWPVRWIGEVITQNRRATLSDERIADIDILFNRCLQELRPTTERGFADLYAIRQALREAGCE